MPQRTPDPEDGGCDVCDDPICYRNQPTTKRPTDAQLAAMLRDVAGYLYTDDGITPATLRPSLLAAADAIEAGERVTQAAAEFDRSFTTAPKDDTTTTED